MNDPSRAAEHKAGAEALLSSLSLFWDRGGKSERAEGNEQEEQSASVMTGNDAGTDISGLESACEGEHIHGLGSLTEVMAESVDGTTVVEGETKLKMIAAGTWATPDRSPERYNSPLHHHRDEPEKTSPENDNTDSEARDSNGDTSPHRHAVNRPPSRPREIGGRSKLGEKDKFKVIVAGRWTATGRAEESAVDASSSTTSSLGEDLEEDEDLEIRGDRRVRQSAEDVLDDDLENNSMSVSSILSMMLHRKYSKSNSSRLEHSQKGISPPRSTQYTRGTYRRWLTEQIYHGSNQEKSTPVRDRESGGNDNIEIAIPSGKQRRSKKETGTISDRSSQPSNDIEIRKNRSKTVAVGHFPDEMCFNNVQLALSDEMDNDSTDHLILKGEASRDDRASSPSKSKKNRSSTRDTGTKQLTRKLRNMDNFVVVPVSKKSLKRPSSSNWVAVGDGNSTEEDSTVEKPEKLSEDCEEEPPPPSESALVTEDVIEKELEGLTPVLAEEIKAMVLSSSSGDIQRRASVLHSSWRNPHDPHVLTLPVARRMYHFDQARKKRAAKYDRNLCSLAELYVHFTGVRTDVEWSEGMTKNLGGKFSTWLKYEREQSTSWTRPYATYFLMAACTVMLMVTFSHSGWTMAPLTENPMVGPDKESLVAAGAMETAKIVQSMQLYRLVASSFIHAGYIHYIINMISLWVVGTAMEGEHGPIQVMVLYLLPAAGGTILSALLMAGAVSVSAGAGTMGLIGACLSDIVAHSSSLFQHRISGDVAKWHCLVVGLLLLDIVVYGALGFVPFLDNFIHLGALLYGMLCGLSTRRTFSREVFGINQSEMQRAKKSLSRTGGFTLTVVGILASFYFLMTADLATLCPSCRAGSCVSFPPWKGMEERWWHCDDCADVDGFAYFNATIQEYDKVDVNCPGGNKVQVIFQDPASKGDIAARMSSYCRMECEQLYFGYNEVMDSEKEAVEERR
uniref:rhomboid protease n=1 Tax=Corethron hystrix TaxID=216773 RepID=A0A7S1BAT6_9STRA